MRTLFRLFTLAAVVSAAALGVTSAAQAIEPTGAPDFTVTVTAPQTIHRGDLATVTVSITNLTESNRLAVATWSLVGPVVARSGYFSVQVKAFKTVTKNFTFTVPKFAPPGTYTLTVNVAGAKAPAIATIGVT
jgi:hypothetical protein